MSTNADGRPNSTTTAEDTGKTVVRQVFAEHERAVAARMEAWRARYRPQEDARRRLAQRFGTDLEKRWATDPNAPRVDAVSLLYAFLIKAGPAHLWSPEMEQAPMLERDDALAAAYMIHAARHDAREREVAVMRHILAQDVTWDELADALDTTADELREQARQHGESPDTWTSNSHTHEVVATS